MKDVCPTCGKNMKRDVAIVIPHTEEHIVEEIKKKNPKWAEKDGSCPKCYDYYKDQIASKK